MLFDLLCDVYHFGGRLRDSKLENKFGGNAYGGLDNGISKSIRCQGRFAASAAKALRKAHSATQPYSHLIVWGTRFYYLLKNIL